MMEDEKSASTIEPQEQEMGNATENIAEMYVRDTRKEEKLEESRKRSNPNDDLEPILVKIENNSGTRERDIHIHNDELSIGRGRNNDEIILNVLISRNHCRLKRNDYGDWMLTNLSSTHTFLNEESLPRGSTHKIGVGDTLQLSESKEFKYLFTMAVRCENIAKRARMEQETLDDQIQTLQGVVDRQKSEFAELQAVEKKELENQLALEKSKQVELRQQLELLLSRQKAEEQDEKLKEQITNLEKKIQVGSIAEEELKGKYDQLVTKLEEEMQKFEEKLAEEKRKWEEALECTRREKETLEATLKLEMEEWKAKEAAEWKSKMESAVQEEKSVREKLSSEKLELVEKMKKMEEAIKEQEAKAQTMQAELKSKVPINIDPQLLKNCIVVDLQNPSNVQMLDTIDLTGETPIYSISPASSKDAEKGAFNRVNDIMEEQLTCSICSELFVTAMTLNCTHTFCRFCIMAWIEKKKECPNCRTKILSLTRSLVIDNFIEKMVENFPSEHKKRRIQLLKERAAPKPKPKMKMVMKKRC